MTVLTLMCAPLWSQAEAASTPLPDPELSWSAIGKQFVTSAAEGGPALAFAALIIICASWVISKTLWPWLKTTSTDFLEESVASRLSREDERVTDQVKFDSLLDLHKGTVDAHVDGLKNLATVMENNAEGHRTSLERMIDNVEGLTLAINGTSPKKKDL